MKRFLSILLMICLCVVGCNGEDLSVANDTELNEELFKELKNENVTLENEVNRLDKEVNSLTVEINELKEEKGQSEEKISGLLEESNNLLEEVNALRDGKIDDEFGNNQYARNCFIRLPIYEKPIQKVEFRDYRWESIVIEETLFFYDDLGADVGYGIDSDHLVVFRNEKERPTFVDNNGKEHQVFGTYQYDDVTYMKNNSNQVYMPSGYTYKDCYDGFVIKDSNEDYILVGDSYTQLLIDQDDFEVVTVCYGDTSVLTKDRHIIYSSNQLLVDRSIETGKDHIISSSLNPWGMVVFGDEVLFSVPFDGPAGLALVNRNDDFLETLNTETVDFTFLHESHDYESALQVYNHDNEKLTTLVTSVVLQVEVTEEGYRYTTDVNSGSGEYDWIYCYMPDDLKTVYWSQYKGHYRKLEGL